MDMVKTKLPIVDKDTGEIIEVDAIVYLYGKASGDKDFIKVFHAFLKDVLEDEEIMRGPFRLFVYILTKKVKRDQLSFFLRCDDVLADLGIVRQTYYRWLGTLLKKGYIKRLAHNYYALRPYTAIVGKMANIDYFEEV
jgi:hypothetical protein